MTERSPKSAEPEIVYGGVRHVLDDLKKKTFKRLRVVRTDVIGPDGAPTDEAAFASVTERVISENQAGDLDGYVFEPL